jgi:glucose-1-phosphate thymidylyltransferase
VDAASAIEGRVIIERGAEIVNSRVLGPAIIGSGTRIENSYVGPFTSVASDCVIVDSELEHSVVLSRSRIVDVPRLTDSLIGREVELTRSTRRPRALRLMLGDHSAVELH